MSAFAQWVALVAALIYIAVFPMESFLIGRPWVQSFLRIRANDVSGIRLWAFAVGGRNLLAGLGVILGLIILHTGSKVVGETLVLTVCAYMFLAGISMAVADALGYYRRKGDGIAGTAAASVPALIALLATALL